MAFGEKGCARATFGLGGLTTRPPVDLQLEMKRAGTGLKNSRHQRDIYEAMVRRRESDIA
jgi:hypothetical protein